jgi:hypothetical protein
MTKGSILRIALNANSSILEAEDVLDFVKYLEEEIELFENEISPNTVDVKL